MNAIPKGFTLKGGGTSDSNIPTVARKVVAFLEKLPFKELVDSRQLASVIGVQLNTLQQHMKDPYVLGNRYNLYSCRVMWGSKRTIRELKRLNGEKP